MYKSKALQILRSMDRKELDRFKDFAESPYCNSNKIVLQLNNFLFTYQPDFTHPNLEKKKAYKILYPGKKFNEAYLRKQLSGLYQLAKEFLIQEELKRQQHFRNTALLNQLLRRGLDNIYHIQFAQSAELLQQEPKKDSKYYFHSYQLAEEAKSFFEQRQNEEEHSLQAKTDNLDVFYLATKLKASCEMLLEVNKHKSRYQFYMIQEVINFLDQTNHPFKQIPIINIYWTILNTLTDKQEDNHFFHLKSMLEKHYKDFNQLEVLEMFNYGQQYCINKISSGQGAYLKELFDLLQFQLEKQLKFKNGYLPIEDYRSLVALGLRLGAYDWVERFLKEYKDKLPEELAEDAYIYYLGTYHHAKGDKQALISHFKDHRFKDMSYTTNARFLLIKTFYHQHAFKALLDELDGFRLLLMRNKEMSTAEKTAIQNFLKLVKRIVRLQYDRRPKTEHIFEEQRQKIKDRFEKMQFFYNKSWVQEIMENLRY